MNNPYLDLTEELNRGRLRTLLSSGQAVVVHRLAQATGDDVVRVEPLAAMSAEGVLPFEPAQGADS
jgi:hypothetical protein